MRIAHLSDLHLCGKYKQKNIVKTNKLLSKLLEQNIDHLIITGDISDNAGEKDFLMLRKILQSFKLLSWDKTSIVIGNHDIFGGVQTAQDILNFPSKCGLVDFTDKVKKFVSHFPELFENTVRISGDDPFPYAKEFKDIVLFGLNSIDRYSKLKNPFASNGKVSKIQREKLKQLFDIERFADKNKIVMMHHHFYKKSDEEKDKINSVWNNIESYTMKLKGRKKLLSFFRENKIDMIVHGHFHEMKDYVKKGIRIINSAASVDEDSPERASAFIIEINENIISAEMKNFDLQRKIYSPNIHNYVFKNNFEVYDESTALVY